MDDELRRLERRLTAAPDPRLALELERARRRAGVALGPRLDDFLDARGANAALVGLLGTLADGAAHPHVVLAGPVGSGKTLLLRAVLAERALGRGDATLWNGVELVARVLDHVRRREALELAAGLHVIDDLDGGAPALLETLAEALDAKGVVAVAAGRVAPALGVALATRRARVIEAPVEPLVPEDRARLFEATLRRIERLEALRHGVLGRAPDVASDPAALPASGFAVEGLARRRALEWLALN